MGLTDVGLGTGFFFCKNVVIPPVPKITDVLIDHFADARALLFFLCRNSVLR